MSLIEKIFQRKAAPSCQFSIVVVAYDMARELPRTLQSLSREYQRDCEHIDYEVLVVDNGSPEPVSESMVNSHGKEFRLLHIKDALPSPGDAINRAVMSARGSHVGIIVDGARMLSPGVIHWAWQAFRLKQRCVTSVLGFHLGPQHQSDSSQAGYDQTSEDKLLQRIRWPEDGYRLFEIAALAGSSRYAWQGPIAESNCIFMPRVLFDEIGGYDTRFASSGGGLINLDFYKRACEAGDVDLVYLAGEGCFHQIHGGVTTGGSEERAVQRYDNLHHEYLNIRGEEFKAPRNTPILLGYSKPTASYLAREGAITMVNKIGLEQGRNSHMKAAGLDNSNGE